MPPGWRASLADGFCLIGGDVWSSRLAPFAAGAAQTFAGKLDAVGVVDETVQDGVGVGRVGYDFVPALHGKLGSHDRRAAAVSLFEDFEEVVPGRSVEGFEPPVVEDQEIGAPERAQDARMAPVAALTLVTLAICFPVNRWRRNATSSSITRRGVGFRSRRGRDERSASPSVRIPTKPPGCNGIMPPGIPD